MMRSSTLGAVLALALAAGGCGKKESADKSPPPAPAPDKAPALGPDKAPAPAPTPPPAPAPAADGVTLSYVVEPPGTKWLEESSMRMEATLMADGQEAPILVTDDKKKRFESLAATAVAVTKARVAYETFAETQKMGPREKTVGAPVVGKTYLLELVDGKLVVTLDGGGEATAEEIALVADDNERFGQPSPMGTALNGKRFVPGEKQTIPAAEMSALFGGGKMTASDFDITLTEMRGELAVFQLQTTMTDASSPMVTTAKLEATAVVEPKTLRLRELTMQAALELSGKASGTGTMTGRRVSTY
jgi:hypothetical protein